jgi:hypothetical protein
MLQFLTLIVMFNGSLDSCQVQVIHCHACAMHTLSVPDCKGTLDKLIVIASVDGEADIEGGEAVPGRLFLIFI